MPGPKWDYGDQSRQHREMLLRQMLSIWGMPALVFAPQEFDNNYDVMDFAEEYVVSNTPTDTTTVLLSQPTKGFRLSDFISLADKVEDYINVTCLDQLGINYQLQITWPDNLTMNLRIIESLTMHPLSRIGNNYKAVVT